MRLGRLGLTVFILGMSLTLLVVFAFGVKVGKDIDSYPATIVGIIPGFQGKVLERPRLEDRQPKADGAGRNDNFKLGFYDSLSGKRADSPDELQGPQTAPEAVKTRPVPEQAPPDGAQHGTARAKAAQSSQEGVSGPGPRQETAPRKAEAPKPMDAVKPESGKYFIQVAAMSSEAKARELKAKLVKLGYAPQLEAVKKEKGKVYRIRITGYATQQDAAKVMGRLEKQVPGTKCLIHKGSE